MNIRKILILSVVLFFATAMVVGSASAYTCTQKVDGKTHTKTLGSDKLIIKGHKVYLKNKVINKHGFNYNIDKIVCYYKNGEEHTYSYDYKRWGISLNKNVVKVKIYYSKLNSKERKGLENSKMIPKKITMKAKPSCCHCCNTHNYKWYTKTFFNYCPACKHYNCLLKDPKHTYENEYTCKVCGADFCGIDGYEKLSHSRWKLIKS